MNNEVISNIIKALVLGWFWCAVVVAVLFLVWFLAIWGASKGWWKVKL